MSPIHADEDIEKYRAEFVKAANTEKWYVCTFVYGEKGARADGVRVVPFCMCFACINL